MMKKSIFFGFLALLLVSEGKAGNTGNTKTVKLLSPSVFVSKAEILKKVAMKEAQFTGKARKFVQPVSQRNKRSGGQNSVQQTNVVFSDLGQSVNPFTVITNGRNCVSVLPSLNTVAFFRRGGPDDAPGVTDRPGNKVYYDLNTKGGADGKWQVSKGPIFTDDIYIDFPGYNPTGADPINYAPRYPQGALWSAAGNTDTNNVMALSVNRVLDGTNGNWGGLGKGWQTLSSNPTQTQTLWSSPDPLHFRTESMEVTSNGSIFLIEPEEDVSGTGVVFTDKIMVYKYTYNPSSNSFDSTVTYIPFANEGGEYETRIASSAIAFGPDGQTGYIALAAANNAYDSVATYHPFIAKTTDGGNTWSDLKLIHINKRWNEMPSPEKDAFRDSLLVGSYVHFSETGISRTTYDDPTKHAVDYLVNDIDLVVDKNNYAHLFASLNVSGFGDTLGSTFPNSTNGIQYYPGYRSWNIDLYINNMDSAARGIFINQNVTLNGTWGDVASTTENITEANRPQLARSADGSVITFCWYDTDTAAYPQLTNDNNSNPDLWIRNMAVGSSGQFKLNDKPRNITKGSDKDGLAILGNVAPTLLNTSNGHMLASTCVTLSDYDPVSTTAVWPVQHLFVGGVSIPSAAAVDSFPIAVNSGKLILEKAEFVKNLNSGDLGVKLMPNPSSGLFSANVRVEKGGEFVVSVVNTLGQTIASEKRNLPAGEVNLPFNFSSLKPGAYLLKMNSQKQSGVHRFIIK